MIKTFPERVALYARNAAITTVVCGMLFLCVRGPGKSLVVAQVQDWRHGANDRSVEVIESLTLPDDISPVNFPDGYRGDDPMDALTHTVSAAMVASETYWDLLEKGWPDDLAAFTAYQVAYALGFGNEAIMALAAPYPAESNMDFWNNRQGFGIFLQVREEAALSPLSREAWNGRIAELALERLQDGDLIRNADADARIYHDPLVDLTNHAGLAIIGVFTSLVVGNELRVARRQRTEYTHELLPAS